MTVLSFEEGDKFIIRTYKRIGDDYQGRWSNAYELVASGSGGLSQLETAATSIVAFERPLTGTMVCFDSYSISTWEPDTSPYNPDNFLVMPLGTTFGTRVNTEPHPPSVCLYLKRGVVTGRTGKLFIRMCLSEEDVELIGKVWSLSEPASIAGEVSDAIDASNIDALFAGTVSVLHLALIGLPKGITVPQVRQINDIVVGGVSEVQMTHRWYNREA